MYLKQALLGLAFVAVHGYQPRRAAALNKSRVSSSQFNSEASDTFGFFAQLRGSEFARHVLAARDHVKLDLNIHRIGATPAKQSRP
jgi:hypothetical protein